MPNDEQRLEEQFFSQEAEKRLSDQLDEAETIDVDVKTDLLKIVQGQADKVSVAGKGLVIKEDIRVQEIKLQTDSIAINPLSALFGQIKLQEPVNAIARIVLTEEDINRAANSEFVLSKSQNFQLQVDAEIVSFDLQQIQVFLPSEGKLAFKGMVLLHEAKNTRQVGFTATIRPRTLSQPIMLESFQCIQGDGVSLEIIVALMQKVKELVNLAYFEFEDTAFCVNNLEVEKGNLVLLIEANLREIPLSLE